jgi:hypothetical protein
MVRTVSVLLAVVLGVGTAALLTSGSRVSYGDESRSCGGPIVSAETAWFDDSVAADPVDRGLDRACAHRVRWQLAGAGLTALLVAIVVGVARTSEEQRAKV